MWAELRGSYQPISGTANGALTMPKDFAGNSPGFILIGWFIRTVTSAAQTFTVTCGGQTGTLTYTCPGPTSWEKHFNHMLYTPVTGITLANFSAGDSWFFELYRMAQT